MRVRGGAVITFALVAAAMVGIAPSSRAVVERRDTPGSVQTSALNRAGTLRCTATFPSRELQPGGDTGIHLTVHNRTGHRIRTSDLASLVIDDASGRRLWTTAFPFPMPYSELRVPPHATRRVHVVLDAGIRWDGRLVVEPNCGAAGELPARRFSVAVPGDTPRPSEAVDALAPLAGPILEGCHPDGRGHVTSGTIAPPDGSGLDPLPVRCWAQVQQHEGFDTVTYFLETPQDAPKTEIGGGSGYGWDRLPRLGNVAVSRWDIVVTDAKVRPVSAIARADTVSNGGWEQDYAWVRGAWHEDGAGACGGERLAIWFTGAGFPVSWLGGCDVSGRMGPPRGMVEGGPVTAHLPGGRVVITTGSVPSERPRSRSR